MVLEYEKITLGQEALLGTIYRFRAEKSKIQKNQLYFGQFFRFLFPPETEVEAMSF